MDIHAVYDGRGRLYRVCSCAESAGRQAHGAGKGAKVADLDGRARVKVRDSAGKQAIVHVDDFVDCYAQDERDLAVAALNAALERRHAGDGSAWGQWYKVDGDGMQVRVLTLGGER